MSKSKDSSSDEQASEDNKKILYFIAMGILAVLVIGPKIKDSLFAQSDKVGCVAVERNQNGIIYHTNDCRYPVNASICERTPMTGWSCSNKTVGPNGIYGWIGGPSIGPLDAFSVDKMHVAACRIGSVPNITDKQAGKYECVKE